MTKKMTKQQKKQKTMQPKVLGSYSHYRPEVCPEMGKIIPNATAQNNGWFDLNFQQNFNNRKKQKNFVDHALIR